MVIIDEHDDVDKNKVYEKLQPQMQFSSIIFGRAGMATAVFSPTQLARLRKAKWEKAWDKLEKDLFARGVLK